MKHSGIFAIMIAAIMTISCNSGKESATAAQIRNAGYVSDTFKTPAGRNVTVFFIKHGSLILDIDGYVAYIDPVTMFKNDFTVLPKADMLLVTHEHGDHYDMAAIEILKDDRTQFISSGRVAELSGMSKAIKPGETLKVEDAKFTLTATPAYNSTPANSNFHPKERQDVGFIFDVDGLRIYVAGDTEDIPELADLKDIDVAFLPVNQPFTMTVEQAIAATETIRPAVVYPYHYGNTDLSPVVDHFKDNSDIEIRIRELQ